MTHGRFASVTSWSGWVWDGDARAMLVRYDDGVPYTAATVRETEPGVFEAIVYERGHRRAFRQQWPWTRDEAEAWCNEHLHMQGMP